MPKRVRVFRYDQTNDKVVETKKRIVKLRPKYPLPVEALAVNPSQVDEAIEDSRRRGVPTNYRRDGTPVMEDSSHYKRFRKAYGYYDKKGFER